MNRVTVTPIDKCWLSNREAQSYLGMKPDFFKRLRQEGVLRYYKVGTSIFYRKRDIDSLLEHGRVT